LVYEFVAITSELFLKQAIKHKPQDDLRTKINAQTILVNLLVMQNFTCNINIRKEERSTNCQKLTIMLLTTKLERNNSIIT
jgi:hypothetical protein